MSGSAGYRQRLEAACLAFLLINDPRYDSSDDKSIIHQRFMSPKRELFENIYYNNGIYFYFFIILIFLPISF